MRIDWNGPGVSKADNVLARSLDRKFGSRNKWNFKSGNTKFYTSAVVDKKRVESSRLSFFRRKKLTDEKFNKSLYLIVKNIYFFILFIF